MQSYLKLNYGVINVMLLSHDVTYQFVLYCVVSKHLLLALSVCVYIGELTVIIQLMHSFEVHIRISQPSKVMFTTVLRLTDPDVN